MLSTIEVNHVIPDAVDNMVFFEPEPFLKYFIGSRIKKQSYFKCPAFLDFYKNTFVIRCPFDFDISINQTDQGINFSIKAEDEKFFKKYIHVDPVENGENQVIHLRFFQLFYSKDSVLLELLPPIMHRNNNDANIISGVYDISKWIRCVEVGMEILNNQQKLTFKRGDPLYYIRFITNKKVNIVKKEMTQDLRYIINACLELKTLIPFNTLEKNYAFAEPLVKLFKRKLFKKRCPFGFGK